MVLLAGFHCNEPCAYHIINVFSSTGLEKPLLRSPYDIQAVVGVNQSENWTNYIRYETL